MLISVLHLIGSQAESEKRPGFSYEVAPPLHCTSILASLMSIYRHGGLILPSELGAYIGIVREQRGLSLGQLSFASRICRGTLSSIENGMISRLKLFDLIHLDDSLQCSGELIVLSWWEVSSRQMLEQEWNQRNLATAYSPQVLHQLLSLLISVGRWLQVIYQGDTIWQSTIRYQLELSDAPTSYEKKQAV
jgi:transcriptional regulator with XRE-family HTH domain